MKYKKLLAIAIAALLVLCLAGCDSTPSVGEDDTNKAPVDSATTNDGVVAEEGVLGDYYVKILNAEKVKTADGKDCLRVYFEFTNNSESDTSFFLATSLRAFQNGIEASTCFIGGENDIPEDDNYMKNIKPGIMIVVTQAFECNYDSPVQVEAAELFTLPNAPKLAKTFTF